MLNFGGVCLCVFKALQIWSCFLPSLTSFLNSGSVVSRLLIKDRCFCFICADATGVFLEYAFHLGLWRILFLLVWHVKKHQPHLQNMQPSNWIIFSSFGVRKTWNHLVTWNSRCNSWVSSTHGDRTRKKTYSTFFVGMWWCRCPEGDKNFTFSGVIGSLRHSEGLMILISMQVQRVGWLLDVDSHQASQFQNPVPNTWLYSYKCSGNLVKPPKVVQPPAIGMIRNFEIRIPAINNQYFMESKRFFFIAQLDHHICFCLPLGTTGTCMFHLYGWHHLPGFRLGTSNFVSLEVEVGKNRGKLLGIFLDNPQGGSMYQLPSKSAIW